MSFSEIKKRYDARTPEFLTMQEYLERCGNDRETHATFPERMVKAIGEPVILDTSKDERLSRIFSNRKIKIFEPFKEFYGMESVIESIYAYFKHAAQNLEEARQVLYLLGPVGGGKSSLAECIKEVSESIPFYTIGVEDSSAPNGVQISPIFESPMGLFNLKLDGKWLSDEYSIKSRYLKPIMSPWAGKRLHEMKNDVERFVVVKMWPSILDQVCITKVEPGDENNQDISSLVGKVNLRMLEDYDQHDPDAYSWSGGMNLTTQGLLDFPEMFKAVIKLLNPMLTATQEGHYNGTEQFGAIPFHGTILAHSNESEWRTFRNNSNNEAFLDRIYLVNVPYCLRVSEEAKIYDKLISNSELSDAPCAPGTKEMMAEMAVLSRLANPGNSNIYSKLEIYDGKNLKEKDPKAKSLTEYKDDAGVTEGMDGLSTRFAFKQLSKVFNYDPEEVAANPIHLMYVLQQQIKMEQFDGDLEDRLLSHLKGIITPKYAEFVGEEIQKAYLESYSDYGQNLFDRYIMLADNWLQDIDYRDPETGESFNKDELNDELKKYEDPADVKNAKDFRSSVVTFVLRQKANTGKDVSWQSYEKLRQVIEKKMFHNTEELLPVISFGTKSTEDESEKHEGFVDRMVSKGYTKKQVRLLVEWYTRYSKNN